MIEKVLHHDAPARPASKLLHVHQPHYSAHTLRHHADRVSVILKRRLQHPDWAELGREQNCKAEDAARNGRICRNIKGNQFALSCQIRSPQRSGIGSETKRRTPQGGGGACAPTSSSGATTTVQKLVRRRRRRSPRRPSPRRSWPVGSLESFRTTPTVRCWRMLEYDPDPNVCVSAFGKTKPLSTMCEQFAWLSQSGKAENIPLLAVSLLLWPVCTAGHLISQKHRHRSLQFASSLTFFVIVAVCHAAQAGRSTPAWCLTRTSRKTPPRETSPQCS